MINQQERSDACPRLIEVALPIREISAESVRQKSPQRGHISTLHLWWARRPLAAARAVVFASLVPDPEDPNCPPEFVVAVERLLKTHVPSELQYYRRGRTVHRDSDPYRPYEGTEDSLRNRLLSFIAKWSPEALAFERGTSHTSPKPNLLLDDRSLIKWECSDPANLQGAEVLRVARELVLAAHNGKAPGFLDPFSGGGAIPLEASRLGAAPIANDYNPVAALILRATCEYPQRYGVPGSRLLVTQEFGQQVERTGQIENVLVHDVEQWCKWILDRARQRIGHLYASGSDERPIIGYFWVRTIPCSNPSCKSPVPLLRSLLLCNKDDKKVALTIEPDFQTKSVRFGTAKNEEIRRVDGTKRERGPAICPFCDQRTSEEQLRSIAQSGLMSHQLVAAVVEGVNGKDYRAIEQADLDAFQAAADIDVDVPREAIRPEVTESPTRVANRGDITVYLYGMKTWGSLFNTRQLATMHTFTVCLREALVAMQSEIADAGYRQAVATYLGLWVSRNSMRMTTVGSWHVTEEKVDKPFEGARLSMKWDYPEANPFSGVSGGFTNQLDFILRVIKRECAVPTSATVLNLDGAHLNLPDNCVDTVVTDPPYFDEAAYADLSDFFYVWLKRGLGTEFPELFSTPQTPKDHEATALKHRHGGNAAAADQHFRTKLTQVFQETRRICAPEGIISVIFAHQEKEAWVALIHSLFAANLTIDATWPIEMEMKNRARGQNSAALQTSITVICRSRVIGAAATFKEVRQEIERVVSDSVKRFWSYGFRGADLIVACYGPAVGAFGRHERVERADGTKVEIGELLDFARRAALNAIAGEFRGDAISNLYYVWANIYGVSEQSWDDARLVAQVGGDSEDTMDLARGHDIFVVDGSTCRLGLLKDRETRKGLGADPNAPHIDALHRAMLLWRLENRSELVEYLSQHGLIDDGPFWKLTQALFEVLPRDIEDWKLRAGRGISGH